MRRTGGTVLQGVVRGAWAATAVCILLLATACGQRTSTSSPEEPRGDNGPVASPETSTASSPTPGTTPFLPGPSAEDPAPPTPPPPPDDLDRRALLIGIDNARGASRLRAAVADAELLEKVLLERGFPPKNTTVLLDEEATRDAILAAITDLGAGASPEGRAVFAFAGHTRRHAGENHIVAADGQTISAGTLAEGLSSVRAPMWVALPTCYAAGFDQPGIVGPNRVTTFASSANERSFESSRLGHSFLFEYMVKRGLDGRESSVEQAFRSATRGLERDYPRYVPVMDDQFPGEFNLGRLSASEPRAQDRSVRPGREDRDAPSRPSPRPSRPSDHQPERKNPPNDDREDPPTDERDDREDHQRKKGLGGWKACGGNLGVGDCDRSEDDD